MRLARIEESKEGELHPGSVSFPSSMTLSQTFNTTCTILELPCAEPFRGDIALWLLCGFELQLSGDVTVRLLG
jgi:hypothetical protein